ncbi:MAG: MBL fold metallo-hydrolase [Gammaproteobacteria bacterium]|nr:MAG: MBL fold metallo-hydrolase [Gammaproteobacteria bacterium]
MQITFLGAAGTVTGSKYLVLAAGKRVLVDCGLFQGLKRLRERNWQPLPIDPASLDAVVLTHAHLDHTGYLPRIARTGYRGPVFCTAATRGLAAILLPDSARIQEEEAEFANRHKYSKHHPALPLYTVDDAEKALKLLRPVEWKSGLELPGGVVLRFTPAGHLLGAASVLLEADGQKVLFSGDVGRPDDPVLNAPAAPPPADWIVIESTYGNRRHQPIDAEAELAAVVSRAVDRGGVIVIPSFAVGRAQMLLHFVARLKARGAIPDIPVYLNSPMATDVTRLYHAHRNEHRLSEDECRTMCTAARFVNSVEESKALNLRRGPMIIISASGMAAGGRVLHHLRAFAPDPKNTIVFSGYQAAGTRGAAMVGGADTVKIHGEWVPVRAEVVQLHGTSGHADRDQLVAWLGSGGALPRRVFVTHGEAVAADAMRQHLRRAIPAEVTVPEHGETVTLD